MNVTTTTMLSLSFVAGLLSSTQAYDAPPSWMPMTMTNVSMTGSQLAVQTQTQAGGPAQIALIEAGSYDPAQPWAVLNNTYFSRRLGWDESINRNFYTTYAADLPANHFVYITQIAQTANGVSVAPGSVLKSYNVKGSNGTSASTNGYAQYEPIFGSGGSSTTWKWDGVMDHNAYAVALSDLSVPNEVFTTTYLLYIGNAAGVANEAFGSTTTTWTWVGPAGIPEPASLSALGLAAVTTLRRRR